jgi:hypothetical protein
MVWFVGVIYPPDKWFTEQLGIDLANLWFSVVLFAGSFCVLALGVILSKLPTGWGVPTIALASLLPAVMFLLPYLMWAFGLIPVYATVWVFALPLSLCGLIAAAFWLRARLPDLPIEE